MRVTNPLVPSSPNMYSNLGEETNHLRISQLYYILKKHALGSFLLSTWNPEQWNGTYHFFSYVLLLLGQFGDLSNQKR